MSSHPSLRRHLSHRTTHPRKQPPSFLSSSSLSVDINLITLSLSHIQPDQNLPRTGSSVPTHSPSLPAAHTTFLRALRQPEAASAAIFCPEKSLPVVVSHREDQSLHTSLRFVFPPAACVQPAEHLNRSRCSDQTLRSCGEVWVVCSVCVLRGKKLLLGKSATRHSYTPCLHFCRCRMRTLPVTSSFLPTSSKFFISWMAFLRKLETFASILQLELTARFIYLVICSEG